ncbi:hypothetical protein [Halorientalis halophila]|uniref:hypothetical protein n=1 Tax=Halorientalis halophila TaxID=3108499 RepID=UPI003008F811
MVLSPEDDGERDDGTAEAAGPAAADGFEALARRLGELAAVLPWSLEGAVLFRDDERVVLARGASSGPAITGPTTAPGPETDAVDGDAGVLVVAEAEDGLSVERCEAAAVDFDVLERIPGGLESVAPE